jgi:hypothetical protein
VAASWVRQRCQAAPGSVAPMASTSPPVGIGGHQGDPGQPAGDQVAEERQPPGAVLGRGDLQAQQFAVPVGVDPDRDQGVHVHDPPGLADLEHQGVGGHRRDLRLRQPRDPEALDQLLHPPGAHPQQIAGGDHAGQGRFGAAAALEQPVREVRALPQLGDRHVQGAGAGVEVAVPVAVAVIGPVVAAFAVGGAADRVGLRRHQGVDHRGQQRTQQVRTRWAKCSCSKRAGSILPDAAIAWTPRS